MVGLNTNESNKNKEVVEAVRQSAVSLIIEFIILLTVFVVILYLPLLLDVVNQTAN